MNRKGDVGPGFWMILVVLFLIIIFIAASGSFGLFFKKVTDSVKELFGFSSSQLEELKKLHNETEQRRADWKSAMNEMCKLLEDAARSVKEGSYDGAINKYIEYSKAYGKYVEGIYTACHGVNTPEQIKFRILNALRDKTYTLVTTGRAAPEYKEPIMDIISRPEFDDTVNLITTLAHIKNNDKSQKDTEILETYQAKDGDLNKKFNNKIYVMVSDYDFMKRGYYSVCPLQYLEGIILDMNNTFSLFELKYSTVSLTALDYKFIKEPYLEIKQHPICKTL